MERDIVINRVLRDMVLMGIITEEESGNSRIYLGTLWTAGYEYGVKETATRNTKKIVQFSMEGKKLGEYGSIMEAARRAGYHPVYGRNAIHNNLCGRYQHTKQGHYWRYANENVG